MVIGWIFIALRGHMYPEWNCTTKICVAINNAFFDWKICRNFIIWCHFCSYCRVISNDYQKWKRWILEHCEFSVNDDKSVISKLSKFSFPNCQNFPFQTVNKVKIQTLISGGSIRCHGRPFHSIIECIYGISSTFDFWNISVYRWINNVFTAWNVWK